LTQEHIKETMNLWFSAIQELEAVQTFLDGNKINEQFYRRLFIRNVFSIIETYLYITKELVKIKLDIDGFGKNQTSWEEVSILHEKRAVLNKTGKIETKDEFQSFIPTLRFSLTIFANVFNSKLPDFGNHNFEKLIHLSKRRNDITHPKSSADLIITSQEISDTVHMFAWFMKAHKDISDGDFLEWFRRIHGKS